MSTFFSRHWSYRLVCLLLATQFSTSGHTEEEHETELQQCLERVCSKVGIPSVRKIQAEIEDKMEKQRNKVEELTREYYSLTDTFLTPILQRNLLLNKKLKESKEILARRSSLELTGPEKRLLNLYWLLSEELTYEEFDEAASLAIQSVPLDEVVDKALADKSISFHKRWVVDGQVRYRGAYGLNAQEQEWILELGKRHLLTREYIEVLVADLMMASAADRAYGYQKFTELKYPGMPIEIAKSKEIAAVLERLKSLHQKLGKTLLQIPGIYALYQATAQFEKPERFPTFLLTRTSWILWKIRLLEGAATDDLFAEFAPRIDRINLGEPGDILPGAERRYLSAKDKFRFLDRYDGSNSLVGEKLNNYIVPYFYLPTEAVNESEFQMKVSSIKDSIRAYITKTYQENHRSLMLQSLDEAIVRPPPTFEAYKNKITEAFRALGQFASDDWEAIKRVRTPFEKLMASLNSNLFFVYTDTVMDTLNENLLPEFPLYDNARFITGEVTISPLALSHPAAFDQIVRHELAHIVSRGLQSSIKAESLRSAYVDQRICLLKNHPEVAKSNLKKGDEELNDSPPDKEPIKKGTMEKVGNLEYEVSIKAEEDWADLIVRATTPPNSINGFCLLGSDSYDIPIGHVEASRHSNPAHRILLLELKLRGELPSECGKEVRDMFPLNLCETD